MLNLCSSEPFLRFPLVRGWESVQRDKSGAAMSDNTVIDLAVMEDTETNSPPTILLYRYVVGIWVSR